MARKKNPFQNIVELNKKNLAALEYLLAKASEEDVVEGLRDIRKQLSVEDTTTEKLPRSVVKIEKLLLEYPEFQKEILSILQKRVKKVKEMGILYKFNADKKPPVQSGPETKQDAAGSEEMASFANEPSVPLQPELEITPAPAVMSPVSVDPAIQPTQELDLATLKRPPQETSILEKEEVAQIPVVEAAQQATQASSEKKDSVEQSAGTEPANLAKKGADTDAMERILKGSNVKTKDEFLIKTIKMDMAELKALINNGKNSQMKE